MASREDTRRRWEKVFKEAFEFDTWGQVEEAWEAYSKLGNAISNEHAENSLGLTAPERLDVQKLGHCVMTRAEELRTGQDQRMGLNNMKKISVYLKGFLVKDDLLFPLQLNNIGPPAAREVVGEEVHEVEGGSLLPPKASVRRGEQFLAITLDKWGFKDESGYIDPYVTVNVVDSKGDLVESSQDTPISNRNKPNYLIFGNTVHIQTALDAMPDNAAIILEFKHYKPKKKKVSTKAWCFFEMSEVKNGPLVCEIYNKPTDPRRKKLSLMTVKQLYVHLELNLRH
mmetsp:Transcript_15635/g.43736  ORF Transcript_15635/g.43736 Transcript_15635/m.43736 type:complete len:284 (-) Transcript_15635:1185-2036(-)